MVTWLWRGYRNYRRLGQIAWVALTALWYFARETRRARKKLFPMPTQKTFSAAGAPNPYRHVRHAMETLGPTFIKIGQFLSARPDLINHLLAQELSRLQDSVVTLSPEVVRSQVVKSLGRPPEEIFRRFDYRPLASASVAQVHKATLMDGREVAVKVQRPELKRLAEQDLLILRGYQGLLARSFPGRLVEIPELINEFSRQIQRELDFTVEGLNMDVFRKLLGPCPGIIVPLVHWSYTTKEILVMDYVRGIKVGEMGEMEKGKAARLLLQSLLVPMLREGIFHGDPHPGNVLLQRDGRIALVDFGLIGRLDETFRQRICFLLLAATQRDVAKVAKLTLEWGKVTGPYSPMRLYEDTAELLDKVSRMDNGTINLGHLICGMIDISLAHHIKLPESFFLLGKTLLAGEGLAKSLDSEVNLMEIALPLATSHLRERLMPRWDEEELYLQSLVYREGLPSFYRQAGEVLSSLAKGEQKVVFVHEGLEPLVRTVERGALYIAGSLILGSLILVYNLGGGIEDTSPFALVGVTGAGLCALFYLLKFSGSRY